MHSERSISDTVSVILIIFMVLVLAIAIMVLVFGTTIFQQKSAFIAPDISNQTINGKNVIRIFHKGGEVAGLKPGTASFYEMGVYADTVFGSERALPLSGVDRFSPGTTIYVFYRPDGRWNITDNTANIAGAQSLPGGAIRIRVVDEKAHLLIAQWPDIGPSVFPNASLAVIAITPNAGYIPQNIGITNLTGTGFQPGATVRLNRTATADIPATNVVIVSSTRITCNFSLTGVPAGQRNVVVTNPDGKSAILANGFTVNAALPAPTVSSISNVTGYRGWTVIERITGTNYVSGSTSKLNRTGVADIPATACTYVSATSLVCSYDLSGKTVSPPNYNVVVTNPDGRSGMRANYFVLSSPAPTISSSTPATGAQGATMVITRLLGTYFQPGAVVVYTNGTTTLPLTGVTVVSSTNITGTLVIPSGATVGPYNVTVTNTDGKYLSRASTFSVTSNAPAVTSITPNTGNRGWPVSVTSLAGTRFQPGAVVKLVNSTAGPDITATSVVVNPANTSITCIFDLNGVPAARRNVTVTNPDGKTGTLANGFTVNSNAPTITSSTPSSGVAGTTVSITNLLGTNFQPGAVVTYWRGSTVIPLSPLAVPLQTQITGSLVIPSGAPAGAYNITVLNTDGRTVRRTSAFTVYAVPPPTISGISPGTGGRGIGVPVIVTGTNIVSGARVRLYNGTTSVYLAPTGTVTPPGQIATTFTVPATVAPGTMSVRITNPDGQYAILSGGYILT
jgi:large repetitive protein